MTQGDSEIDTPLRLVDVEQALRLTPFDAAAAQRSMSPDYRDRRADPGRPDPIRPAAALLYLFERAGRLHFPLTLRREDLREHRGQVSLPGGRPEAGETSLETAVREAHEEVALDPGLPAALGTLAPVYIPPTHTALTVHVAAGPDPQGLEPEAREVAEIRLAALDHLIDPRYREVETRRHRGRDVEVPFFRLADWTVWGATAIALAELSARLDTVS